MKKRYVETDASQNSFHSYLLLANPLTSEAQTNLLIVINSHILCVSLCNPLLTTVIYSDNIVCDSDCIVCDSGNNTHSNNSE